MQGCAISEDIMALRFSEEEYAQFIARSGRKKPEAQTAQQIDKPPRRAKYGNRKTECNGILFDSKHEATIYQDLCLRLRAGELRGVVLQQPFMLPGNTVYRADFVTLNNDGTYSVLDAKSKATARDKVYVMKKRLMRECLGLEITEV
jgi:hypothetical protein